MESGGLCDRVVTGNSELDNWIWTIEYLAKFKTELGMLHDVFQMGPKLPDYLGEGTNEMVAFRCLASLFDCSTSEQSQDVVSDAESKIEFDTPKTCEYVLQCILDEMIEPSCAKETGVSPRCGQVDGGEPGQVTPRETDPDPTGSIEDRQSFVHAPGDGDGDETRHEGFPNEGDDHVSSPLENGYRCIQCKESGRLLFCSSDGCSVMVHEKCMELPPAYDDAGNFYCSHCALTCASANFLHYQEEVAKAKKKLVLFIRLMSDVNEKKCI